MTVGGDGSSRWYSSTWTGCSESPTVMPPGVPASVIGARLATMPALIAAMSAIHVLATPLSGGLNGYHAPMFIGRLVIDAMCLWVPACLESDYGQGAHVASHLGIGGELAAIALGHQATS